MSDLHSLELPKRSFKGIGLVILTHALIVWGLASGLATHFTKKEQPPTVLIDRPDKPREPDPVPLEPPKQVFAPVRPVQIEVRDFHEDTPVSPLTVSTEAQAPSTGTAAGSGGPAGGDKGVATTPPTVAPLRAEALCDVMAAPDMPSVNWSGRAELRIQARLVAGRVAEVQFLGMTGGLDARTRRALQTAVQAALGGYQCRGNQSFEQTFVFNVQ